jgi:hypothetical protein
MSNRNGEKLISSEGIAAFATGSRATAEPKLNHAVEPWEMLSQAFHPRVE